MRWASLAIVALLALPASSTDARRGPKVVAIAKLPAPPSTPEASAPEATDDEAAKAAKAALAAATNDPIFAGADRVVGRDQPGYVAFTFDDGPTPATTPVVLDALQTYDIPATFFIVTRHLNHPRDREQARQLLAKELELGFTVGNHTAHHARLEHTTDEKLLVREVDEAVMTLTAHAKRPIGLFRAPYGKLSTFAKDHLHEMGVTDVFWSIDSRDWETAEEDAAELRRSILEMIVADNGGVVLMHDTRKVTAKVIRDVFDDLEHENCRRLAKHETPIWPVSLHYFLRDAGVPRAIPDDVQKRTAAYQQALPDRCALRARKTGRK
ncbi:MAG TPA: polysaccharide deacetylase family protein [Kofleriaceae bacterium]|nr:polysaccharide deacetylase family protein [Kofleriaceae bacterium]